MNDPSGIAIQGDPRGAIDEQEAAAYRSRFPIFERSVYLNSCSLGPLSVDALEALNQYAVAWSSYGAPAWWREWLPALQDAKTKFAELINAAPEEVTVSHSVSSALSSIASTFDYVNRDSVVCADLDFPTIPYQWLAKRRLGVDVRVARSPDRVTVPLEEYARHVDSRTCLIATSHTFYTSGHIQPIRELAHLAHASGGFIAVDGYHAVGVHPVDVKELGVDFYVGGPLKWLLGGPGLTFIYARQELLPSLQPTITGWFAARDQFRFDSAVLDWPDTADRLELGTPAVSTAYAGIAGMTMIAGVGVDRIYARIQELTQRIVERADVAGYGIRSPRSPNTRGGIVMLEVAEPERTVQELFDRGFTVDYRPGLVRVSPHFYNTMADVDTFMNALDDVQQALG